MTDRELLELAAKAAGVKRVIMNGWCGDIVKRRDQEDGGGLFDPLTDDGDALRLAVKLELQICRGIARDMETGNTEVVGDELDPYAATRRAIVRAAAAIGKEMK